MAFYPDLFIKVLGTFLILIFGLIAAKVLTNIVRRIFRTIELNKVLNEYFNFNLDLDKHLVTFLKYLIYLVTIILMLNQLGIPSNILKWLLLGILILIILFIVLAFKDWLPNLIAGIYIISSRKLKAGELIDINGVKGRIIKVNLLETQIETNNKEVIFIPNANMNKYYLVKKKNG
jgi:small-conductance mechanosensitive channel